MQLPSEDEHPGRVVPLHSAAVGGTELEGLFRDHHQRLVHYLRLRLGSKAEAEDAAQSAFLRLHARRHSLVKGNIIALLYVTARNISTDIIRNRTVYQKLLNNNFGDLEDIHVQYSTVSADLLLSAKQDIEAILKIVTELTEKCRVSFIHYKFLGWEYCEIAEKLHVTESMVRKYVLKATAHCARRLAEMEGSL